MDLSKVESFQVIGQCSKMQTFTWGEELNLLGGIPYDINFFQDFSRMYVEGLLLKDVPVSNLIKAIDHMASKTASPSAGNTPQKENDRYGHESSHFDWDCFFEQQKKEQKQEKKWEKAHRKINQKDAWENFALAYELITGEII